MEPGEQKRPESGFKKVAGTAKQIYQSNFGVDPNEAFQRSEAELRSRYEEIEKKQKELLEEKRKLNLAAIKSFNKNLGSVKPNWKVHATCFMAGCVLYIAGSWILEKR